MWRLALDLGVGSIGWAAFRLDQDGKEYALFDGGVRLFPDGREAQKGTPLNARRQQQRSVRRNRERVLKRQKELADRMVRHGLLENPEQNLQHINPYEARAKAAEEAVEPEILARALLHISKNRGFKSNRKSGNAKEDGTNLKRIAAFKERLGDQTIGQFQYAYIQADKEAEAAAKQVGDFHERTRLRFRGENEFYPSRALISEELDRIWQQQKDAGTLKEEGWQELREAILFQRSLKPQERGRCRFYLDEYRAYRALPSSENFRIEQDLAHLKWIDADRRGHFLTPEQRQRIREELYTKKSVAFTSLLKLKTTSKERLFPDTVAFNLETEANTKMIGAETFLTLEKVLGSDLPADVEVQDLLVETLISADDNESLHEHLKALGYNEQQIGALAKLSFKDGTASLSTRAILQLTEALQNGMTYDQAVLELDGLDADRLHHSAKWIDADQIGKPLPYYGALLPSSVIGGKPAECDPEKDPEGHYGRINNPTVHVALNQLRRLIKVLIAKHGPPCQVVVEVAREMKQSEKQRKETQKFQAHNRKENERLRDWAARELGMPRLSRTDLQKLKLWEELGASETTRRCVFTGKLISAAQVLGPEIEIEHILPFSRTLDDRMANKTLAFKAANNLKGNRTPYEAFGGNEHAGKPSGDYHWDAILARALSLPGYKAWRFGPDAMERFDNKERGFIERSLNDTKYLSRITSEYLTHLVGAGKLWVVTGQLTASLRHEWGLNHLLSDGPDKDRSDNRHHLVDAFVIGMTTRSLLQKMAKESRYTSDHKLDKFVPELGSIRTDLESLMERVVISYKPDHGVNGQFFKETAYGCSPPPVDMEQDRKYTVRVAVDNLKSDPKSFGVSNLKGISDPAIRAELMDFLAEGEEAGEKEKALLNRFMMERLPDLVAARGIKKLRVRVLNQSVTMIESTPYKGYAVGGYGFCDIWRIPGKKGKPEKYEGAFIPLHLANLAAKGKYDPNEAKPHPAAKRLMRLFKDDMVSYVEDGQTKICKVFGFSASDNRLDVRDNCLPGTAQLYSSINILGQKQLRKVFVNPDGSIKGGNQ